MPAIDAQFADKIVTEITKTYGFRKTRGAWLQEGLCPQCGERELFTAAADPKLVKCGRINNCGYEISVRDALPDLFEDWSKRFEPTEEEPNATADAYLRFERGLDLAGLRGAFTQEHFHDRHRAIATATVRFPLPGGSWWERFIDRPGRFDKKANFKFGGTWRGHAWAHPEDTLAVLATMDEIWLEEGIFDAIATRQNFARLTKAGAKAKRTAVSLMTCNCWPEHFLTGLRAAIANGPHPTHRPKLIFAFDVGAAGVKFTRKFVAQARREGWQAQAAQVRPDGEGAKLDWNDLWIRQQSWSGDAGKGPLDEGALDEYLWNGDITIAETAHEKAHLIHEHKVWASFHFRFDNRLYWAKSKTSGEDGERSTLNVEEIANCAFRILYRERDEAIDETNYFLEVAFPGGIPTAKARFSSATCAASAEFKKRLFAFAGMWLGSQDQLDRLMRGQTRQLKTVEPIHFTGYSPAHRAWVLGDIAVHDGRVIKIGPERYFDVGKAAVKLRTEERMLAIAYEPDKLSIDWLDDVWTAWGPRGLVTLAWFTMSLFAVQIREVHQSLGFLEVWGEAGSGKTTLIAFMWKLLGRAQYEGFDPNKATNAAIARNFMKVSNLPVGLIESGRKDDEPRYARQFDWAELLTLFNGRSPRALGVKSSGTETFEPPFFGAIYLMQNSTVDSMPAVLERIMSFHVDKAMWSPESKAAAIRLERYPIEQASGWIVHVARNAAKWLPHFFERFEHHDAELPKRMPDLHNARVIKCYAQLCAATEALGQVISAKKLPAAWIEQTLEFIDRSALDRQLSSGADHPIVQRFWEQVDHLISNETETQWADGKSLNQSRKPDEYFAISLVEFERRARGIGLMPPADAELKRHLKGSRYRKFLAAKSVNNPADRGVHCWVFQRPAADKPVI